MSIVGGRVRQKAAALVAHPNAASPHFGSLPIFGMGSNHHQVLPTAESGDGSATAGPASKYAVQEGVADRNGGDGNANFPEQHQSDGFVAVHGSDSEASDDERGDNGADEQGGHAKSSEIESVDDIEAAVDNNRGASAKQNAAASPPGSRRTYTPAAVQPVENASESMIRPFHDSSTVAAGGGRPRLPPISKDGGGVGYENV